jgi:GTP cyclohydrolase II
MALDMKAQPAMKLQKIAEADFPTRYGNLRIFGFQQGEDEAVVLVLGRPAENCQPPLVRIHSQCLTGDVFGSLRCDCRDQLQLSLQLISAEGCGLVIYELKEGRGIGLMNKLQAYELQDRGVDTVEANRRLGFAPDLRNYALPAAILEHFGLSAVRLLSNNPGKVQALEQAGITVVERLPCEVRPTETRRRYLRTKKDKLGHLLTNV